MTKAELINRIVEHDDIESKASADRLFTFIKSIIKDELVAGNEVKLGEDFGTFKLATQSAKSGNMNGKAWKSPAKSVVKFRPSAALKSAVA